MLLKSNKNFSNIPIDTDGSPFNLSRANGLSLVETGVDGIFVLFGHPPERVLDDNGVLCLLRTIF